MRLILWPARPSRLGTRKNESFEGGAKRTALLALFLSGIPAVPFGIQ